MRKVKELIKKCWFKLNGKMIIHFLHIGKTGGTAIKHALKGNLRTEKSVITLNSHGTTLMDIPVGEKVVFFLRDPISRFLSGFYSRKRKGQPRAFYEWTPQEKDAFNMFSTPQNLATALLSTNKDERLKAEKAMKCIRHVRDSYWTWFDSEEYLRSRLSDIFFIGFQETLSADFEILKAKLGLPQDVLLPRNEIHAHKNPSDLDLNLNKEQRAVLKKWYEKDYEFIQMCKEIKKREEQGLNNHER